jgi:hypothetical protein
MVITLCVVVLSVGCLFTLYLRGELSPYELEGLERSARQCYETRERLHRYLKTGKPLRRWFLIRAEWEVEAEKRAAKALRDNAYEARRRAAIKQRLKDTFR